MAISNNQIVALSSDTTTPPIEQLIALASSIDDSTNIEKLRNEIRRLALLLILEKAECLGEPETES